MRRKERCSVRQTERERERGRKGRQRGGKTGGNAISKGIRDERRKGGEKETWNEKR